MYIGYEVKFFMPTYKMPCVWGLDLKKITLHADQEFIGRPPIAKIIIAEN